MTNDDHASKHGDDQLFRSTASQTAWNRYIILGYQTTSGRDFARGLWTKRYSHTMRFHRAIWYNYFLVHVDQGKGLLEKLHFWATQVAHPYLIAFDPGSLDPGSLDMDSD